MKTKHVAFVAVMLAFVFLAHAAGRFTQIGGAQVAASMAIYILLALLIAPELKWPALIGIGLAVGVLTTLASSSPFPESNMADHSLGFLLACLFTKELVKKQEARVSQMVIISGVVVLFSWTIAATLEWLAFLGTSFTTSDFSVYNIDFGAGFLAWWAFGFVAVAIPTFLLSAILTPILYRTMRPALIGQGIISLS